MSLYGFVIQSIPALAEQGLTAAFVRDGNLWIWTEGEESQVTQESGVSRPKWSHDGTWIAYSQDSHIKLYNIKTKKTYPVFHNGRNFQWAPNRNVLAFLDEGSILNIYDASKAGDANEHFANVALGVNNYSWTPDGSGFLASTDANLHPDGWTNPILYKIPAQPGLNPGKAERLFTIPGKLKDGDDVEIPSIGTTIFKWSPDQEWIAFVVNPTASFSADYDMLCVLSADGKTFHTVGVMLNSPNWFKWAPSQNKIGYIAGFGRIGLKNHKELKVTRLPDRQTDSYTLGGFAPRGFTWENNGTIVVSRVKQKNPEQESPPSLYRINTREKQQKITVPPKSFGDFDPHYLKQINQLAWIRSNEERASVWLANPDGSKAHVWIENVDGLFYPGGWSELIDVYTSNPKKTR